MKCALQLESHHYSKAQASKWVQSQDQVCIVEGHPYSKAQASKCKGSNHDSKAQTSKVEWLKVRLDI